MDDHKVYLRPPVWLPILVVLIAGGAYIVGKKVETRSIDMVNITVTGQGRVFANPDIAQISFGVQTGRQRTAEAAMTTLTERMNAVIAAVESLGIEKKDIMTQQLSLNPSYDWNEGVRIDQGFEASQNLRVKIRELDNIGDVLSAAATAGANQVGGVSFTIDDQDDLKEQARNEAIEEAKMKAEKLAAQLGKSLGKITGFWEDQGGYVMESRAMMMDAGYGGGGDAIPAPSVPTGEQEVAVSVNITYQLK